MVKSCFDVMRTGLDLAYSVVLVTTCVYNYLIAPEVVCLLIKCNGSVTTAVKSMFPRSLAIVCFVSRITAVYKNVSDLPEYRGKIHEYDSNFPIDFPTRNARRLFTAVVILAYVVIILPLNVSRVYLIYDNFRDNRMMLFFVAMYAHNWSICLTEIQFVVRCFGLYQKFRSVNEDMAAVLSEIIIANKYPAALCVTDSEPRRRGQTTANDGDPRPQKSVNARCVTVNKIELFRMRYQFVRRTLDTLNRLHGIQLGLSICILFTLALFDIYGEKYTINHKTRSKLFIYGWLFQYSFRFCAIILTTHITTKQAHKTKKLITDINNRHLDDNTKEENHLFKIVLGANSIFSVLGADSMFDEVLHLIFGANSMIAPSENVTTMYHQFIANYRGFNIQHFYIVHTQLQLFLSQLCSRSGEFTTCDFFTLNTRLITSAIVAGTSYLIILLQFDGTSEKDN